MSVAGGANGLAQLVAQGDDPAVQIAQRFIIADAPLVHEESVVGYRLNLKIVVEGGYLLNFAFGLVVENCAEQLSRFAGGADYKTVAQLFEPSFRYTRVASVI